MKEELTVPCPKCGRPTKSVDSWSMHSKLAPTRCYVFRCWYCSLRWRKIVREEKAGSKKAEEWE